MKDLAPHLVRQRLLIEGFTGSRVTRESIDGYFSHLTSGLNLQRYGVPAIFSPGGQGKEENQGFDAFCPLIDSGISLYYWASAGFVSIVVYTCKSFDPQKAIELTSDFFKLTSWESESF